MDSSKECIVIKKAHDHWAFLEHIEAPMWADLTLEPNSGGEDINDDGWFSVSHLFHSWSSHQLKSKFSKPGNETVTSEIDSPELPSSVSRSRGKHYRSKNWGVNLDGLFDKQVPASGSSRIYSREVAGFDPEVKAKANGIKSKGTASEKLGLVSGRNARGNAMLNCTKSMAATGRSMVIRSGSTGNKTGASNSRSTITSEHTQRPENLTDVSSTSYDNKSQLSFCNNSMGLRKSCVLKKALREIIVEDSKKPRESKSTSGKSSVGSCPNPVSDGSSGDSKKSRQRNSSSGKSSVGSCSNPASDGKEVAIVNPAAKNPGKLANVSTKSTVKFEEPKLSNRSGTTIESAKPTNCKTTKSLSQHQNVRSRALLPANKQNSLTIATKGQQKNGKPGLAGKRNENTASSVADHQKSSKREDITGGLPNDQKITGRSILQKSDRAGSTTLQGKITRDAKNTNHLAKRIYFR